MHTSHDTGGIGGLMIALFHKLERKRNKCRCYRNAGDADNQPLNTAVYSAAANLIMHACT